MNDFIRIPTNPVPEGAEVFRFEAPDGVTLRGAFFPAQRPRGTVVLLTGWSEFIEKYFEAAEDFHKRGLNVAMMDWRGQGLSDRESPVQSKWRGYFETLKNDLEHFTETIVVPHFGGPYILATHSMGGLPALMLLAKGYDRFSRAVLSAPLTRLFAGPMNIVNGFASGLASAVGLAKQTVAGQNDDAFEFEGNMFTSDKTRHQRFRDLQLAEPKAALVRPTYGWVREACKDAAKIHRADYFTKLKTPVLMVSAGDERRIDGGDHAKLASLNDLMSITVIEGALHEIMVERDDIRDQYFAAFDTFVAPVFETQQTAPQTTD